VKRATKCPNCGEPVTVFAAACAICGRDLVEHRRQLERRRVSLPSPGRSFAGIDPHLLLVAVTLLAILISPLLGLLLAALGAHDRHRGGLIGQRNLFLALAAIDLVLFLIPSFRFGILSLLS
jgi:hypothetical protein